MRDVLTVVAVVGIVVYMIGRQVMGEPLRAKRLFMLPLILAVVGVIDVSKHGSHPHLADIVLLVLGVLVAIAIGVIQGLSMRLESRNGYLWGQLPFRSLWLWVGLIVTHGAILLVAQGVGAHVADGAAAIIVALGANRLAQAAVVAPRALAAGIQFAPEKDGTSLLSGLFVSGVGGAAPRPSSDSNLASDGQAPHPRSGYTPRVSPTDIIGPTSDDHFVVDEVPFTRNGPTPRPNLAWSLLSGLSNTLIQKDNASGSGAIPVQVRRAENLSRQDWRVLLQQIVGRMDGRNRLTQRTTIRQRYRR